MRIGIGPTLEEYKVRVLEEIDWAYQTNLKSHVTSEHVLKYYEAMGLINGSLTREECPFLDSEARATGLDIEALALVVVEKARASATYEANRRSLKERIRMATDVDEINDLIADHKPEIDIGRHY